MQGKAYNPSINVDKLVNCCEKTIADYYSEQRLFALCDYEIRPAFINVQLAENPNLH